MACKLILKFKDTVISEIPLDKEETTIGRKPENTIHIDNLAVSGRHARVLKIGNKVILEDLGSTNGTFVNDKQITKHILQHGDSVVIGKHLLTFVSLEEKPAVSAHEPDENDMDKTMVITPQARSAMISKNGASSPIGSTMPLAGLQIIGGPLAGKKMELTASLTSLGKG
jgi:pSer/pThr/pTyr-binding forkhead associated (FHA) protein